MAIQDEAPIRNKKKKSLMSPLADRMGLDMSTDMVAGTPRPPLPQTEPGLLGGPPEANLNQTQNQTVIGKVTDKLKKRKKGLPNERT
jgi:hypothetical protein